MKIENLKQLKQLIALCRKTGIEAIKVDGLEIALGATPVVVTRSRAPKAKYTQESDNGPIETPDTLTDEQLLMWSVGDQ